MTCWAKEWVWGLNFNVLIIHSACDTEGKLTLTTLLGDLAHEVFLPSLNCQS